MDPSQLLSVIVPCFNEEAVIAATHAQLSEVLRRIGMTYEIVYVDDGSSDRTVPILTQLQSADPAVRVLCLSRNFGHQMAVTAGLDHVSGDAVVIIDADLQDPPEIIEQMVQQWRAGHDVVYGQRRHREGETAFKIWTAGGFYRLINRVSDTEIPLDTGDFRLMDRKVVRALTQMPEHDRFLRGMVAWVGFRQMPLVYDRSARAAGQSKYPLRKMLRFAVDGILSFSLIPLRLATALGIISCCLAIFGILYALVVRLFTHNWEHGWATIFIAILFLGGVQLVSIGIIGEYVGRIYREVKRRPLYLLRQKLGFEEKG